jgi:hypothetical protein
MNLSAMPPIIIASVIVKIIMLIARLHPSSRPRTAIVATHD